MKIIDCEFHYYLPELMDYLSTRDKAMRYYPETKVLEVRDKPSHPIGKLAVDAFGHKQVYEDRGIRKRAIIGIGKLDCGEPYDIPNEDPEIEVLGASSDHTILDVEDYGRDLKAGDIIELRIKYAQLMYMTSRNDVYVKYI